MLSKVNKLSALSLNFLIADFCGKYASAHDLT